MHTDGPFMTAAIHPPFDPALLLVEDGEFLARYTFTSHGMTRQGMCVARPTPDGGMQLMIGETALRIHVQRMICGDADAIIRSWLALTPNGDPDKVAATAMSVDYRLDGRVTGATPISVDEARRPRRTHAHTEAGARKARSRRWPRVNIPNTLVRPYRHTARDGRQWDMLGVTLPAGTRIHGNDVGGWRFSAFADRHSSRDKAEGLPVTVTLRPDRPIDLYQGRGEARACMRVDDPWDLCRAIKAAATPTCDELYETACIDIAAGEHYSIPMAGPWDTPAHTR